MMTHDEFEDSAKKFCDEFHERLTDTQDWDELEALRESLREHMVKIHRLRAALAEDAMQRLTDVQQEMDGGKLPPPSDHIADANKMEATVGRKDQLKAANTGRQRVQLNDGGAQNAQQK